MAKIAGQYTNGVNIRVVKFVRGQTFEVVANATHEYILRGHKNAREYVGRLLSHGYTRG